VVNVIHGKSLSGTWCGRGGRKEEHIESERMRKEGAGKEWRI